MVNRLKEVSGTHSSKSNNRHNPADILEPFPGNAGELHAEIDLGRSDPSVQNLRDANLSGRQFQDASLQFRDLRDVLHLHQGALRGADLSGAALPQSYEFDLDAVNDLIRSCRTLFVALLTTSAYLTITAASTRDVDLLTASRQFNLPIVGAEISLTGFYALAPAGLVGFALYFYLHIERLFDRLASLPAIFPSGSSIDEVTTPWLTTELIRLRQPRLRHLTSRSWLVRVAMGTPLTWFVVPSAIAFIWLRYLKRHDPWITTLHLVYLIVAVLTSFWTLHLSVGASGTRRALAAATFTAGASFIAATGYISFAVLSGSALPPTMATVLGQIGYQPHLRLVGAIVSTRPANWAPAFDPNFEEVTGASLAHASLRDAEAQHVFLARADLTQADLRSADLKRARLQFADLTGVNATDAVLDQAELRGAHLHGGVFRGVQASGVNVEDAVAKNADFSGAILTDSNFRNADLTGAVLRSAYLVEARLSGADLRRADLSGANMFGATLYGADLSGALLEHADLRGAELSTTIGLTQQQCDSARMDVHSRSSCK